MLLMYFLSDFETVSVVSIIIGITFAFTFQMRCFPIVRSLHFRIYYYYYYYYYYFIMVVIIIFLLTSLLQTRLLSTCHTISYSWFGFQNDVRSELHRCPIAVQFSKCPANSSLLKRKNSTQHFIADNLSLMYFLILITPRVPDTS
jgi:hypothetical protein